MTTDDIINAHKEKLRRYSKYTNCMNAWVKISREVDLLYNHLSDNQKNELQKKNRGNKNTKGVCSQAGNTDTWYTDAIQSPYKPVYGVRRGRGRFRKKDNGVRE